MAERSGKERPELLLVAHDEDPAVGGPVELARHERRMRRARLAALHRAGVEVPGARIVQVEEREVEEARIDVAAAARLARAEDGGDEPEAGDHAGHEVDDREAV